MTIKSALKDKKISIYRLAKMSGIPYSTVNDICNNKVRLEKCSAETVYHLSQALQIPMEKLLSAYCEPRSSFENFKSSICHRVKEMGDINFIIDVIENDEVRMYYNRAWFPECLYLLAMIDYLSRENDIPIDNEYDDIRQYKLEKLIYPSSLWALAETCKDDTILNKAYQESIPEFKRFNIIENEVRNVI